MKKIINYVFVGLAATFLFTVIAYAEVAVERIMIDTPSMYVETSKSMYMTAKIYPPNATNKEVTWSSSDTTIASINSSTGGLTTKNKNGVVTIKATAVDGSGIVGTIKLYVGYANVKVGEETSIGNVNSVPYDTVEWSIDDPTVLEKTNRTGYTSIGSSYWHTQYVRGLKNGNTIVRMKTISGDILASNTVYVYTALESINNNYDSYEIEHGTTKQLEITFAPNDVSPEFKIVHYTSDDSTIASVSDSGLITGLKTGQTNIKVYSQYYEKSLTIPVNVVIYTNDITINTSKINLDNDNNSFQLEYEVLPIDATNKEVIFTSNDTSIATVTKNGKVVAISNGETNIKVKTKDGKVSREIPVVVSNFNPCTNILFSEDDIRIKSGESKKINYTLVPDNCTNIKLNWSVEDESVAAVDENGTVTGLKTGETTLVIEADNGLKYTKIINVDDYVGVKSFDIVDEKVVVTTEGNIPSYQINYNLAPSNATFKKVNWTIGDESIATVDENGKITAKSAGTTTLIGTTEDGNITDTIGIDVIVGHYTVRISLAKDVTREGSSCGFSSVTIEEKKVYYPDKYIFKDYYQIDGYRFNSLYSDFDCLSYSNALLGKIDNNFNFEYSGESYTFYGGDMVAIPVDNISIANKYWNTIYYPNGNEYWYNFNVIFNDNKSLPNNKKLKLISENVGVIQVDDNWIEPQFCNDNHCIYSVKETIISGNRANIKVCTQDNNKCDYIYLNSNPNKLSEQLHYDSATGNYTIGILNNTTAKDFYSDYSYNAGDYYIVDKNNNRISDNDIIDDTMLFVPTNLEGNRIDNIWDQESVNNYYREKHFSLLYRINVNSTYCDGFVLNRSNEEWSHTPGSVIGYEKNDRIKVTCYNIERKYKNYGIKLINKATGADITNSVQFKVMENNTFEFIMPNYDIEIVDYADTLDLHNPIVNIIGNNNSHRITWDKQELADYYYVYKSTSPTSGYALVAQVNDMNSAEYTSNNLTFGKTYYYKIQAKNYYYNINTETIVSMKATPNKVENLRVTSIGQKSIKIAWDKVSVTGYEVYMNGKKVKTITKNGTLSYNKKSLKVNKTYSFKVRAYKTVKGKKKYGAFSETIYVRTAPATPKKPGISLNDYNALNLNVKGVGGAVKYEIVRSSTKKGTYEKVGEITSAGTYVDGNLNTGWTYYYKVRACNSDNTCSPYTSIVSKRVVPRTPSISVWSPETKKVIITTTQVNSAEGYEIYRSTRKSSGYKKVGDITDAENLTLENATSKGKTYYYKVRTYTTFNGVRVYSAYSSIKKIRSK